MALITIETTTPGMFLDILSMTANPGNYRAVFQYPDPDNSYYCKTFLAAALVLFRTNSLNLKMREVPVTRELIDLFLDMTTPVDLTPFLANYRGIATVEAMDRLQPGTVISEKDDVDASSELNSEQVSAFYGLFSNLP